MTDASGSPIKRRRRRPADLRALIIQTAEAVFTEQGYDGATTVEIARRAGVNRAVLWRHFPTKQDLFRESMSQPFLDFVESWIPRWEAHEMDSLTDEEMVRTFVTELYSKLREHRAAARMLMFADAPNPSLQEDTYSAVGALTKDLQRVFRRELERRGYPIETSELTGRAFLSLIMVTAILDDTMIPTEKEFSEEEIVEHLARFALRGANLGEDKR